MPTESTIFECDGCLFVFLTPPEFEGFFGDSSYKVTLCIACTKKYKAKEKADAGN